MTATVLPFARRSADSSREKAEETRIASELERRAFIREVREALSPRAGRIKLLKKLRRDEDAVLLARRLGSDLERVKKLSRGALSKTLECAGLKLTTRARYALFAGDTATEKRVRKLQPYVSLSDTIAEMLQQDVDLFLFEKLDGINLEELEQANDDEAVRLGFLIAQMARAVAEQTGLDAFFDLAAKTPGMMDERGQRFQPSTMTVLRDRAHEGGSDHWTEQQPVPSVPICRILEQSISGRALIGPWAKLTSMSYSKLAKAADEVAPNDVVDVTIEIWREIGLSVGERYQAGAIGPMFSGRAHIKVIFDDVVATPFYPWTLEHLFPWAWDHVFGKPAILVEGERWTTCRMETELDEEFSWFWREPRPGPGESDIAVEHYYFSKHPVNAWTLRHLLDRSAIDGKSECLLPEVAAEKCLDVYRFSGEIGQRFEDALYSGYLEDTLRGETIRLQDELTEYRSGRKKKFSAQDEEMLRRWNAAEPANHEKPEEN